MNIKLRAPEFKRFSSMISMLQDRSKFQNKKNMQFIVYKINLTIHRNTPQCAVVLLGMDELIGGN